MRLNLLYFLSAFILLASFKTHAQSAYQKRVYTTEQGNELPYRILYPENYKRNKKYPLIIMLHGAGERGNDNEKQLVHGSKLFLQDSIRTKFPAIVIFPQCPEDNFWASVKINTSKRPYDINFDYNQTLNWPLQAAIDLAGKLTQEERIDKKRIYIMGLSMGGMGTFEALTRYPDLFAAAIPICGGGNIGLAGNYAKQVPLWIFHGAEDNIVDPAYSRDMYKQLQSLNALVKYTEYPDVNHNSWDKAFAEPELLPWLFTKRKSGKFLPFFRRRNN